MTGTDTICSGCGSVEDLADIKGRAAQAISCCPERKMVPITRANITTLRQQLAEARNALVAIEDMGKDLKGAKMATLKIGLSFLCDTASEALKANGDDT